MPYNIYVINEGYSRMVNKSTMAANCTSTLIKGPNNIIVDTMTPWDKDIIINGLKKHNVSCEDISHVICTHGHSDHIGNNNLFVNAKEHIVGFSISYKDQYKLHPFESGEEYKIDEDITILPTPGHTSDDITVLVRTSHYGIVAVAGDLFEREEDLNDPSLWRETAGSQFPDKQEANRNKILALVDYIVPGHGPMFKVSQEIKDQLKSS
ncbi:metallo-beta-lactamase domain-containing protein 1 [Homalodisca vitripennis]|uniref:metallo-beta-lactamase domain-containing protein 1 n=1 Tax=Homalodisca vitripennis TaxID=197043 RepID=UPI001EEB0D93|nr:metallo-beta-lactamase domain-containing protein 1 [Homalodisca vitripennis]XP_046659473.1 metallo-beta-lactamase domain-containing protein 1 [Homalodisca vitripennis]